MRIRTVAPLLLATFLASCAGDAEEATTDDAFVASADTQEITALVASWQQHYNLHHASMVADLYADDAVRLHSAGADEGRDDIIAALEAQIAGSPTAEIGVGETMVFGDQAVSFGSYGVETTNAEGAELAFSGAWMTFMSKASGEWKITLDINNLDAPAPEGYPYPEGEEGDLPPDEGTMTDMISGYATHWNLGHPSMVADYYTEDASAALANNPMTHGREAISALMAERMEATPSQITLHDVRTVELGDGWALDAGWYQMDAPDDGGALQSGTYMVLAAQQDDDSWQIQWAVSNGQPAGM